MPTRRGLVLLVAGAARVVAGRFLALVELGTLGLVLVSLVGVMCLSVCVQTLRMRHLLQLTFARTHPASYVFADEPFPVTLVATARRSRVPLCSVIESLGVPYPADPTNRAHSSGSSRSSGPASPMGSIPSIASIASIRSIGSTGSSTKAHRLLRAGLCRTGDLRYEQMFPRGWHRLGPGRVTVVDSLALAWLPFTSIPTTQALVWPRAVDLGPETIARLFAQSQTGFDSEQGDLRQYVPGDDLRRVHWATTARTSRLMVRGTDHISRSHEARRIVLDASATSHRGDSFELAVSVAASLLLSADPEDRIDFVVDGPSGERLFPTIGLAMAELAIIAPDRQSTLLGIETVLDWKAGIVVIGEQTPIPQHVRGPVIRCMNPAAGSAEATTPRLAREHRTDRRHRVPTLPTSPTSSTSPADDAHHDNAHHDDAHHDDVSGQTVLRVTSLETLVDALSDSGLPEITARSLRFGT